MMLRAPKPTSFFAIHQLDKYINSTHTSSWRSLLFVRANTPRAIGFLYYFSHWQLLWQMHCSVTFGVLWALYFFTNPSFLLVLAAGEDHGLFHWKFSKSPELSGDISACDTLKIDILPFNETQPAPLSKPPYYMRTFVLGGVPQTTLIGTSNDNVFWKVDQPIGSKLLLNVIDSNGSSGGVAASENVVVAGKTADCIISPPPSDFSIAANVTDDLVTCQPWGITIRGGAPPYTVTLLQPGSPVATNQTMSGRDDRYTYINRASPANVLVAAVNDVNGRFANGTLRINTKGSTEMTCNGLESSSSTDPSIKRVDPVDPVEPVEPVEPAQQPVVPGPDFDRAAALTSAKHRKLVATIVAVCVGVLLFLVLVGLGVWYYTRKRRNQVPRSRREVASSFNLWANGTSVEPYSVPRSIQSPVQEMKRYRSEGSHHAEGGFSAHSLHWTQGQAVSPTEATQMTEDRSGLSTASAWQVSSVEALSQPDFGGDSDYSVRPGNAERPPPPYLNYGEKGVR